MTFNRWFAPLLASRRHPRAASNSYRRRTSVAKTFRPRLEHLEERSLLAIVAWDGGGGDSDWGNIANWLGDALPGAADDVVISAGFPGVVHSGVSTVNSVAADSPLTLPGGRLDVSTTLSVTSTFVLAGGVLANATVVSGTTLRVDYISTLDGVTLNGDLDVTGSHPALGNQMIVDIQNGLTLNGTAYLGSADGSTFGHLDFYSSQTVDGSGDIFFGSHPNNSLRSGPNTLTLGPDLLVHGRAGYLDGDIVNQGTVDADVAAGHIQFIGVGLTNSGRLASSAAASLLHVRPTIWSSSGTLSATGGGTLTLDGSGTVLIGGLNAGADYGQVLLDGGTVNLSNNLSLGITNGFFPQINDSFMVIDNREANPINGTFAGLTDEAEFVADGHRFRIDYHGGDGNDVVLTSLGPAAIHWDGNTDGDGDGVNWTNPFNWVGDVLPGPADDVVIDLGDNNFTVFLNSAADVRSVVSHAQISIGGVGDLSVSSPSTILALSLTNGAALSGTGDVSIDNDLTLTDSSICGSGAVTVQGDVSLAGSALSGRSVSVAGDMRVFPVNRLYSGAVVDVAGRILLEHNGWLNRGDASNVLLRSTGSIEKTSGTSWASLHVPIESTGPVILTSGELDLGEQNGSGHSTFSGPITGASGTQLNLEGSSGGLTISGSIDVDRLYFPAPSTRRVEGSLRANWLRTSGTTTFAGPILELGETILAGTTTFTPADGTPQSVTFGSLDLNGELNGIDNFVVTGNARLTGVLRGPGTELTIQGSLDIDNTHIFRNISVAGEMRVFPVNRLYSGAVLDVAGRILMEHNGWLNRGDASNVLLRSSGSIEKTSGASWASLHVPIESNGPVILTSGELDLGDQNGVGLSTLAGSISGTNGTQLNLYGPHHFAATATIDADRITVLRLFGAELAGRAAPFCNARVTAQTEIAIQAGTTLDLSLTSTFQAQVGDTFLLMDKQAAGPINGTFSGLAEGATISVDARSFRLSYLGGDGNDVVLTYLGSAFWDGASDGDGDGVSWNDPLNWAGDSLPGPGDDVVIDLGDNNFTVVHSTGVDSVKSITSRASLAITGGELAVAGDSQIDSAFIVSGGVWRSHAALMVGGLFDWSGGRLQGVAGQGRLTAPGGMNASGRPVLDDFELISPASTTATWSGDYLLFERAAAWDNFGNLTFPNATTLDSASGAARFSNHGTLSAHADARIEINNFTNNGLIEIAAGTLVTQSGNGLNTGTIVGAAETTLRFQATFVGTLGSRIEGDHVVVTGMATLAGSLQADQTTVTGSAIMTGEVHSFGPLTVGGLLDVSAATLAPGVTMLPTLTLSGALVTGDDWTISGAFNWSGGRLQGVAGQRSLTAAGGMTASGSLTLDDFHLINPAGQLATWENSFILMEHVSRWDNHGQLITRGDARIDTAFVTATFYNDGVVEVESGRTFIQDINTIANDGLIHVQAGAALWIGSVGGNLLNRGEVQGEIGSELLFRGQSLEGIAGSRIKGDHVSVATLLILDLAGPAAPFDNAIVKAETEISLGLGTTLDLRLTADFSARLGDTFTLLDKHASGPINGTFNGLGERATIAVGGYEFRLTYLGGNGNDVTLTVTDIPYVSWDGSSDGDGDGVHWNDPLNWAGDLLPGPDDDVVIDLGDNSFTVVLASGDHSVRSLTSYAALAMPGGSLVFAEDSTILGGLTVSKGSARLDSATASLTVASLALSSSTLDGTADIHVTGMLFNGGSMTGTGTTYAEGGFSWSLNAGYNYLGRRLVNSGPATMTGPGLLYVYDTGRLDNLGTGTIEAAGSWTLGGPAAAFRNDGVFRKTAGSDRIRFQGEFVNNGLVAVESGELATGYGTSSGSFIGSSGTTLVLNYQTLTAASSVIADHVLFSGTSTLAGYYSASGSTGGYNGSANFTGQIDSLGAVSFTAGGITLNPQSPTSLTVPSLVLAGGFLDGAADVHVTGTLFIGGEMTGTGTTYAESGFTWALNAGYNYLGRRVVNSGSATMTGAGLLYVYNTGRVDNLSTGTIEAAGSWVFGGPAAAFRNDGVFRKTAGSDRITFQGEFVNNGLVAVESGELATGYGTSSGSFSGSSGTTLVLNDQTLTATSSFIADHVLFGGTSTLAGYYSASGSTGGYNGSAILTGQVGSLGAVNFAAGGITLNPQSPTSITVPSLVLAGGYLDGAADVHVTGTLFIGGEMTGTGTTYAESGFTWTLNAGYNYLGRRVVNSGSATMSGAGLLYVYNTGRVDNLSTGTIEAAGSWVFGGPAAAFRNDGVFRKLGPDRITFQGEFVNAGAVVVEGGDLAASIVQTGGTTRLAGGSISGDVQIQAGSFTGSGDVFANVSIAGQAAPGQSPGVISVHGSYTQTGELSIELGGILPGSASSNHDQMSATGPNIQLAGMLSVQLINGFVPQIGNSFTIIDNRGADPIQGAFAGLADEAEFVADDHRFRIDYNGGDGNDVVLTSLGPAAIYWDGSTDGDGDGVNWHDPFNWSGDVLPGPDDDVVIDLGDNNFTVVHALGSHSIGSLTSNASLAVSGGELIVANDSTIHGTFAVAGGVWSSTGDLTVAGSFVWSGGTLRGESGQGSLTAAGGMTASGNLILDDFHLINPVGQVATYQGALFLMDHVARWDNHGHLTLLGNTLINSGLVTSTFHNSGTVEIAGGRGVFFTGVTTNYGTIHIQADADLTLGYPGFSTVTNNGHVLGEPGAELEFEGTLIGTLGSSIRGDRLVLRGQATIAGTYEAGQTSNSGTTTLKGDVLSFGPLDVTGVLDVRGAALAPGVTALLSLTLPGTLITDDEWTIAGVFNLAGVWDSSADLTVGGPFVWTGGALRGGAGQGRLLANGGMTTAGNVSLDNFHLVNPAGQFATYQGSLFLMIHVARWDNAGHLTLQGDTSINSAVVTSTFYNSGTVEIAGGRGILFSGVTTNDGTMHVQAGADLTLGYPGFSTVTNNGQVLGEPGAELEFDGTLMNTPGASILGDRIVLGGQSAIAGTYQAGQTTSIGPTAITAEVLSLGSLSVAGLLDVSGATFAPGVTTLPSLHLTGTFLTDDDWTVVGNFNWVGGRLQGASGQPTLTAAAGMTAAGEVALDNFHLINPAGQSATYQGALFLMEHVSRWDNAGHLTLLGDTLINSGLITSTFYNSGAVEIAGGRGVFFAGVTTNDGTIHVQSDADLTLGYPGFSTVTNHGALLGGASAELVFQGTLVSTAGSTIRGDDITIHPGTALELQLPPGFSAHVGDSVTLIDKPTAGPIDGTFDGLAEGATIALGDYEFRLSYAGGDGNDATLTVLASPNPITGVTLSEEGLLLVLGDSGNDHVEVTSASGGRIRVEFGGEVYFFDEDQVTAIELRLGDGDDDARVANSITIPSFIDGGAGDDRLRGADVMIGGDGDDEIKEGKGASLIYGGNGNDEIHAGANGDTIDGGDGDDRLFGGSGNDVIFGGGGNDEIHGGTGDDTIDGGDGDDEINAGNGDDVVFGGEGNDDVEGGAGNDRILLGAGLDTADGGAGRDLIDGGGDGDEISGGAGDDILLGGAGDDILVGGAGRDLLIGGLGADNLEGGSDDDLLIGGSTSYDQDYAALDLISREWRSSDSYSVRISKLHNGTGSILTGSGVQLLGSGPQQTVFDDNAGDMLNGQSGRDWFFADLDGTSGDDDSIHNPAGNELLELL